MRRFTVMGRGSLRGATLKNARSSLCTLKEGGHEYLLLYKEAMHELKLLSDLGNDVDLQAYFSAVVLPLRRAYAWGVPSHRALKEIADVSPNGVIECGAGTGYWACLLHEEYGVDVVAYDSHPCHDGAYLNGFHTLGKMGNAIPFAHVDEGGAEAAACHPDRTLLLCWPPREMDGSGSGDVDVAYLARDALAQYTGDTVAYVGVCRAAIEAYGDGEEPSDGDGGEAGAERAVVRFDTAGPVFERALKAQFEMTAHVPLPNWPPLHDSLTIWRRKGSTNRARVDDSGASNRIAQGEDLDRLVPQARRSSDSTWAAARRSRARMAALASIRWEKFDRGWLLRTLAQAYQTRGSDAACATPRPEITEMTQRCLRTAPWPLRMLCRTIGIQWLLGGK